MDEGAKPEKNPTDPIEENNENNSNTSNTNISMPDLSGIIGNIKEPGVKDNKNTGADPELDEKYNNLFADLEKVFYNLIIMKMENPEEYKKWPEEKRDKVELGIEKMFSNETSKKSFNSVLCDHPDIVTVFTNVFFEEYINEMCNSIINEDYLIHLLDLITRKINEKLYKTNQPHRVLYFYRNDTGESTLSTLNYIEDDGKKYGSFINLPYKPPV